MIAITDPHATIEELLEVVLSVWPVLRVYKSPAAIRNQSV
jgi:hypothetical protein